MRQSIKMSSSWSTSLFSHHSLAPSIESVLPVRCVSDIGTYNFTFGLIQWISENVINHINIVHDNNPHNNDRVFEAVTLFTHCHLFHILGYEGFSVPQRPLRANCALRAAVFRGGTNQPNPAGEGKMSQARLATQGYTGSRWRVLQSKTHCYFILVISHWCVLLSNPVS